MKKSHMLLVGLTLVVCFIVFLIIRNQGSSSVVESQSTYVPRDITGPKFKPLVQGKAPELRHHIEIMKRHGLWSLAGAVEDLLAGKDFTELNPRQQMEVRNFVAQSDNKIVALIIDKIPQDLN